MNEKMRKCGFPYKNEKNKTTVSMNEISRTGYSKVFSIFLQNQRDSGLLAITNEKNREWAKINSSLFNESLMT